MITITKRITDTIPRADIEDPILFSKAELKSNYSIGWSGSMKAGSVHLAQIMTFFLKAVLIILEALVRVIVPPYEKELYNDIVLITGSGHGIGRELAVKFASLGSTIVCWDKSEEANRQTIKILCAMGFNNVHAYTCDVSKRDEVLMTARRVEKEVGFVTILVNNAGIMPCKQFDSHDSHLVRNVFDVNVLAHFWTLEAFLPNMKLRNFGHVVAISSMCGISGLPYAVPYSASKFAVRGLMDALNEEMRISDKDIKFTTVYPFTVDTGLVRKPKNRFPSLMSILKPDAVAEQVVRAVRQDIKEVSVPGSLLLADSVTRFLPVKLAQHVRDFVDTGVYPED